MDIYFKSTDAYEKIYSFIESILYSISNKEQKECLFLENLFSQLEFQCDDIVLTESKGRFANPSLRLFFSFLAEKRSAMDADEFGYFFSSFGNMTRLDYGTGHELNFLCFLYVLVKKEKIAENTVFSALKRYFALVRKLILKFQIEPAGSLGAWGLDDYQILPFLFGAAEQPDTVNLQTASTGELKDALDFIMKHKNMYTVRKKGLREHSPMLYSLKDYPCDILSKKILNIYDELVLARDVVTQHFIYTEYLKK